MDDVGTSGKWKLLVNDGESIEVEGVLLSYVSSWSPSHNPQVHPDGQEGGHKWWGDSGKRLRCNACRWTEFRLFREETEGKPVDVRPYLLHFTSRSGVPGEVTRYRVQDELSPAAVIEMLTIRKNGGAYLSAPAALLLAQATAFDEKELKEAYDKRLVK